MSDREGCHMYMEGMGELESSVRKGIRYIVRDRGHNLEIYHVVLGEGVLTD